jgi:hypothetical protein
MLSIVLFATCLYGAAVLIDLLVGIADEVHELANAPQNDDT